MGLRRKKAGRREPRVDIFPIPGFGLRPSARDRVAPPEPADPPRRATTARKEKRAANEGAARPRARRAESEPDAQPARKRGGGAGAGGGDGKRRSPLGGLVWWGVVRGLWGAIAGVGAFVWIAAHLPPIQSLEVPPRPPAVQILGLGARTLATRGDMGGAAVALKDLPP